MPLPLGIVAEEGKNVNPYWLTMSDYPAISTTANDDGAVAYDIGSNSYSAYRYGTNNIVVVKQALRGDILWRKLITTGQTAIGFAGMVVDSAQNVYVGITNSNTFNAWFYKLDISGNIVWARQLAFSSTPLGLGNVTLAIDNAENLIIAATSNFSTTQRGIEILKINSNTAAIIWQQRYAHTNNSVSITLRSNISVDSNNNLYVFGSYTDPIASSVFGGIIKFNSNGTALWANRIYNGVATNRLLYDSRLASASDGSIYLVQNIPAAGSPNMRIVKCDTSGTILWNDTVLSADTDFRPLAAACDSSDNLYFTSIYSTTTPRYQIMRKASSNGAVTWQRQLQSGVTMRPGALNGLVNNTRSFFMFPVIYGVTNFSGAYFKVPLDGTRTGTYTLDTIGWQYSANTLSSGTETITSASILQTQFTGNLFFSSITNPTVSNFTGSFFTTNLI